MYNTGSRTIDNISSNIHKMVS